MNNNSSNDGYNSEEDPNYPPTKNEGEVIKNSKSGTKNSKSASKSGKKTKKYRKW